MRDQKPRLRKFACLAAIAAMLALSGRAAERDLDNLLLVRLPAPPEGRRAPLQVMDMPTGDIETSEVAELSPLTFAVIVSGGNRRHKQVGDAKSEILHLFALDPLPSHTSTRNRDLPSTCLRVARYRSS
jgi:hypothetical protein